jgi:hypothetical protein
MTKTDDDQKASMTFFYNGNIAHVAMFDCALTDEQIAAIAGSIRIPWWKRLYFWFKNIFRRRRSLAQVIMKMKPFLYMPLDDKSGDLKLYYRDSDGREDIITVAPKESSDD